MATAAHSADMSAPGSEASGISEKQGLPSPSDPGALLQGGQGETAAIAMDDAEAATQGAAGDDQPNPEDRIQRRDSYYWEEDAPEVPVTRLVTDNLHWASQQLLHGIEYVGEIFAEFLNLSQSRYEWALEAAREQEEEEEEAERIRVQRERWAEIQRLKKEEEEAKKAAAAEGEGAAAPREPSTTSPANDSNHNGNGEGSGLLAAVAAAVSSSALSVSPPAAASREGGEGDAASDNTAPKEGNDMA